MLEIALVLSTLLAVGLVGLLTTIVTPPLMTELGLWTLAVGLIAGLPTGFWYHVLLYRLLARKTTVPAGWWWSPVDFHQQLAREEVALIKPWFLLGGVGFILSLAGGMAAMAGLLLAG
ncbi:MAG: hypothetical protein HZA21_05230 [Nitrospirae bacterium]|nr:hypothetical protein [Nitrospirota bacterium]